MRILLLVLVTLCAGCRSVPEQRRPEREAELRVDVQPLEPNKAHVVAKFTTKF